MELIAIIAVFKGENPRWTTVHRFGSVTTPITVERKETNIIIQIPGYNRYIKYPETKLILKLLEHILAEKIEFSTGNTESKENSIGASSAEKPTSKRGPDQHYSGKKPPMPSPQPNVKNPAQNVAENWVESLKQNEDYCLVPGEITARREKAVAFHVLGKSQLWIPISQIRDLGEYEQINGLWVKRWILEKNLEALTAA